MRRAKSPKKQLEDMQEEEQLQKRLDWIREQSNDKTIDEDSKDWDEHVESYEEAMREYYFQETGNMDINHER